MKKKLDTINSTYLKFNIALKEKNSTLGKYINSRFLFYLMYVVTINWTTLLYMNIGIWTEKIVVIN